MAKRLPEETSAAIERLAARSTKVMISRAEED
jgi:hypothetical protein